MEKKLDYNGRWRNRIVAFRVSDEEAKLLNQSGGIIRTDETGLYYETAFVP